MPSPLPIDSLLPELTELLRTGRNLVLVAPPGAGKTTRFPPAVVDAGLLPPATPTVVLLQPRRVAARAVASRIGQERGWRLGEEVGYQIRFENRTGPRTRIKVLTEGILTRQIQSDPFLEGVGCVILDEFHERSIHTDVALAMLREVQQTVREDLRLVVMSATMDPGPVAAFLGDAPIRQSPGRPFPVRIDFAGKASTEPVWEKAAAGVRRVASAGTGHVLVFLPGIGEIRRTEGLLEGLPFERHILHSSVSADDQDRALAPSSRRKLILATNIAETSITIDGVDTVIDSGLARVLLTDQRLGIDRLELRRISRASANQRAGRAGRTGPGRCLRLWTREEDAGLEESEAAEIHRVDLAATILALRQYGIRTPADFGWFERPREEALRRGEALLEMLRAVDGKGQLTPLGKRLAGLPVHPRLGALLLAGAELGVPRQAATIAALLSERDIVTSAPQARRREAKWSGPSDLLDRLDLIEGGSRDGVDPQALRAVLRLRDELADAAQRSARGTAPARDADTAVRRALLHAYPDRVTLRRANDPSRGVMVGSRGVVLEPSSQVREASLFLSLDPRDPPGGGGGEARVSLASAIDFEWLEEVHPHLLERRARYRFDEGRAKVLALRETLFAGLPLKEEIASTPANDEAVAQALADFLKPKLEDMIERHEAAARYVARVRLAHKHLGGQGFPSFEGDDLEAALHDACRGARTVADVERHLRGALEERVPWPLRAVLDREIPEALPVPSGNKLKLQFDLHAGPPVLAVRLQELFGLAETPRIASGRVAVVLHLLGPNYRPVQITQDLRNFWNTTYAEVRKELRARYPKHPWPEDPWNAPPVSVGRRAPKSSS